MDFIEKLGQMFDRVVDEVGQEAGRLGVQGSAELASALFNGTPTSLTGRDRIATRECTTWKGHTATRMKSSARTTDVRCNCLVKNDDTSP